jgi:hypothetical protein
MGWILLALLGVVVVKGAGGGKQSSGGGDGSQSPIRSGSALLRKGKTYRIEMTVRGGKVDDPNQRAVIAHDLETGLVSTGAYDVYVSPTIPMTVAYSYVATADTPVMLGLASDQSINGVAASYAFSSVQQIAAKKAA